MAPIEPVSEAYEPYYAEDGYLMTRPDYFSAPTLPLIGIPASTSSRDDQRPGVRPATAYETAQLLEYFRIIKDMDKEELQTIADAYVVVITHYMTDGPGYGGDVMVAIYGGDPAFVETFTWDRAGRLKPALELAHINTI